MSDPSTPNADAVLVGVALAGIIAVAASGGGWDLYDSMVGIVLAVVLWTYGRIGPRSFADKRELLTFSLVFGFLTVLIFGVLLDEIIVRFGWHYDDEPTGTRWGGLWIALIWALVSFGASVRIKAKGWIAPTESEEKGATER